MTSIPLHASSALAWLSLHRDRLRRVGLSFALVLFAGGLFLAFRAVPDISERLSLWPVALLILVSPASIALTTAEFHLMARMGGNPTTWRTSLDVTVYTAAANLLPLPGGVIARVAAMKAYGTPIRTASGLTALFFGLWGGLAFCWSGAALWFVGHPAPAAAFSAIGAGLLIITGIAALRLRTPRRMVPSVVFVRLAMLALEALRMMLAVYALGGAIGFAGASVFAVSAFIGIAVAFVPGGLGVREGVVALMSPLIGLDPAIGFLAAALNRAARLLGLAGMAAYRLLSSGSK